jgi:hypothetical protein
MSSGPDCRDRDADRPIDADWGRRLARSCPSCPGFLCIDADEVAGIVAGATGNPGILAYSNRLAPTDKPDIGYAMIFPGMTILKILFVYIVSKLF